MYFPFGVTTLLYQLKLTVRLSENGDIQYLENRILDDGIFNIPEYQYRIGK